MNQTHLPYRLSEPSFRKYEDLVAEVVSKFPAFVVLNPERVGDSHVTLATRLRDAMLSLYENRWNTNKVDMNKFALYYDEIVVSHKRKYVIAGSKDSLRDFYLSTEAKGTMSDGDVGWYINEPTNSFVIENIEQGKLLCQLVAKKQVSVPIEVLWLALEDIQSLEEDFDILVRKTDKEKTFILE